MAPHRPPPAQQGAQGPGTFHADPCRGLPAPGPVPGHRGAGDGQDAPASCWKSTSAAEEQQVRVLPGSLWNRKWPELARPGHLEIAGLMCIPPPGGRPGGGAALFPPPPGAEGSPWPPAAGCHAAGAVHGHEPRL